MTTTEAEWGHPLIGPSGERLRVPEEAYRKLERLGVKKRYSIRLSPAIYGMLDPRYDTLTDGLRRILGRDLGGPAWVVCMCKECRKREADADNTELPGRARSELAAETAINEMRRVSPRRRGAEARLAPRPLDRRRR